MNEKTIKKSIENHRKQNKKKSNNILFSIDEYSLFNSGLNEKRTEKKIENYIERKVIRFD